MCQLIHHYIVLGKRTVFQMSDRFHSPCHQLSHRWCFRSENYSPFSRKNGYETNASRPIGNAEALYSCLIVTNHERLIFYTIYCGRHLTEYCGRKTIQSLFTHRITARIIRKSFTTVSLLSLSIADLCPNWCNRDVSWSYQDFFRELFLKKQIRKHHTPGQENVSLLLDWNAGAFLPPEEFKNLLHIQNTWKQTKRCRQSRDRLKSLLYIKW
jgi:hypothetical protein